MPPRQAAVLGVSLVVAAALVRLAVASNEFWLDEIWSLFIALDRDTVGRILAARNDNNHLLNTLYLRAIGLTDTWIVYRLLAVACGTATVALVLACEPAARRLEALAAATLMAFSYPLVLYSAEARGYGPAVFCAVASFYAVERYWTTAGRGALPAFWIAVAVGLLSHATYLQAYLALLAWSLIRAVQVHGVSGRALGRLAALHALALVMVAAFYQFFLRGMVLGGGQPYRTLEVVRETAAYATGMPYAFGTAALLLITAVAVAGTVLLRRRDSPRWSFFVLVLAVVPAALLILTQPPILYFRYFLVPVAFFCLLAGDVLGWLAERGSAARIAAAGMLGLYVMAQAPALYGLATTGRGGCVAAVQFMAARTAGDEIVVGSDEEFRSQLMLWYFARFLPPGKQLRYLAQPQWPAAGPEWLVLHDLTPGVERPTGYQDGRGNRFDRMAAFECGGARRWYWTLYRRAG
jgi:hypothetical protein